MATAFTPEDRIAAGRMAEALMTAARPTMRQGRGAMKGVRVVTPVLTEGTVNLIEFLLRKIEAGNEPAKEDA